MALKGSFLDVAAVSAGEADKRAIRATGRSCNENMSVAHDHRQVETATSTAASNSAIGSMDYSEEYI
jgi:hypothetical protein